MERGKRKRKKRGGKGREWKGSPSADPRVQCPKRISHALVWEHMFSRKIYV